MKILKTIFLVILILIAIPLGLQTVISLLKAISVIARSGDPYNTGYSIGTLTANLLLLIIVIYGIIRLRPKKETKKGISHIIVIISLIAAIGLFVWVIIYSVNKKSVPGNTSVSIPAYEYKSASSINTTFEEYVSEKHGFKVRFPTIPAVNDYGAAVNYSSAIENEGGYSVFVGFNQGRTLKEKDFEPFFNGYLKGRMEQAGNNANLIWSRQVLFLGCRGLEYEHSAQLEGNTFYFQGIFFIYNNRVYLVSVVCPEGSKQSAYSKFDDFVRSFSLLK